MSIPSNVQDTFTSADINVGVGANQVLIAAQGANKQIWVYGLGGSAGSAAGSISIQDEDDDAFTGIIPLAANGPYNLEMTENPYMPWFKVGTNKALEMDTVGCTYDGVIAYAIVDV